MPQDTYKVLHTVKWPQRGKHHQLIPLMPHTLIFQMRTCSEFCKVVVGLKGTACTPYKRFLNGIPFWSKLPSLRSATLSFCPLQWGGGVKTRNKMLTCVALSPFQLNTSNQLRATQHPPVSLKAESSHVWAKLWPRGGRKMGHNHKLSLWRKWGQIL